MSREKGLDLDALEALEKEATAAPWNHFGDRLWGPEQAHIMHGEGDLACWITRHEDAALITELRNAFPALLRAAREKEAYLDRAERAEAMWNEHVNANDCLRQVWRERERAERAEQEAARERGRAEKWKALAVAASDLLAVYHDASMLVAGPLLVGGDKHYQNWVRGHFSIIEHSPHVRVGIETLLAAENTTARPDANCYTLPDGSCSSTKPCMHTPGFFKKG